MSSGSSEYEECVESGREEIELTSLDREIRATLYDKGLTTIEKHIRYYGSVTNALCKLDPDFKPEKFAFEIRIVNGSKEGEGDCESGSHSVVRVVRTGRWKVRAKRIKTTVAGLIAPSIGAVLAVFLRKCLPI